MKITITIIFNYALMITLTGNYVYFHILYLRISQRRAISRRYPLIFSATPLRFNVARFAFDFVTNDEWD